MSHLSKGRRLFLSILGIGLAIGFGLLVGKYLTVENRSFSHAAVQDAINIILPSSRQLPALQLASTHNRVQDTQKLTGQWSLIFFGYTFCPDICPTTLAELRQL